MRFLSPLLTVILTPLLAVSPLSAQLPIGAGGAVMVDPPAQDLQIRLVESEGFAAQTNTRAEKGFAVAVTTASGQAVPDVAVVFRMPDSGATGTFGDGTHAAIAYTDSAGIARFRGIQWGGLTGLIAVRITASKGSSHAGILLEHSLNQAVASERPVATENNKTALLAPPMITIPEQDPVTYAYVPAKPVPPPLTPGVVSKTGTAASEISLPRTKPDSVSKSLAQEPVVSVTSASPDTKIHSSSKTKWIVIAAVAAGAGIGVAMLAGKGKPTTSAAPASTISIGTPTVSVGNP